MDEQLQDVIDGDSDGDQDDEQPPVDPGGVRSSPRKRGGVDARPEFVTIRHIVDIVKSRHLLYANRDSDRIKGKSVELFRGVARALLLGSKGGTQSCGLASFQRRKNRFTWSRKEMDLVDPRHPIHHLDAANLEAAR